MLYEPSPAYLEMTIAELIDLWPEVISVFLKHRMRCVGCQMAKFMTLEEELQYYKVSAPQFLDELTKIIQPISTQDNDPE